MDKADPFREMVKPFVGVRIENRFAALGGKVRNMADIPRHRPV